MNKHFTENTQMANNMRRGFTLFVIRELQIKITMKYHFTSISMAKSKTLSVPNAGEAGGQCWWFSH